MYTHLATPIDIERCIRASEGTYDLKGAEFPTIIAESMDRERVYGFLSTWFSNGAICAGPLWVNPSVGGFLRGRVTLSLFQSYEYILDQAGVSCYLAYIPQDMKQYMRMLNRAVDLVPYDMDEAGNLWFERRLDGRALS